MKTLKFDEDDRKCVIAVIESHHSTRLARIGKFRKFLADPTGKPYLILGGYDDWHGIPSKILEEAKARQAKGGLLVIARRLPTSIAIYTGDLMLLVENERALSHTREGDFQFNVSVRARTMSVKEVPSLVLQMLESPIETGVPVIKILKRMTPAERYKVLESIQKK